MEPYAVNTEQQTTAEPFAVNAPAIPVVPNISPALMELRADKAAYSVDAPPQDFYDKFKKGLEQQVRTDTSLNFEKANKDVFQQNLLSFSSKYGRNPTTQELNELTDHLERNRQYANPQGIFEFALSRKAYQMFNAYSANTPGSWWQSYVKDEPEQSLYESYLGQDFTRKYGVLNRKYQDAKAKYDASSWGRYGADVALNFLSLGTYGESLQRGNVSGTPFQLTPGADREAQAKTLLLKKWDDFNGDVEKIDNYFKGKDNPSEELAFWQQMTGAYSPSELNLSAMINLLPVVGGAYKGVKSLAGLWARKASTDVSLAVNGPEKPKIAVPAAIGNQEEAAVQHVSDVVVRAKNGESPIQDVLDSMPPFMNPSIDIYDAPKPYREQANRIKETPQVRDLLSTLETDPKIDIAPELTATPENIRKWKDAKVKEYDGPSNQVLDVTYNGPIVWEPKVNVHYLEMKVGKGNGEYWANPEEAIEGAKALNIGLKGFEDMARQLQLENDLKVSIEKLGYHRAITNPSDETAALLGLTKPTNEQYAGAVKKLEQQYTSQVRELSELRNSPGAVIKNDGNGFYISHWSAMRPLTKVTRDMLLSTPNSITPEGFASKFLNKIRTIGETFSKDMDTAAKVASYGGTNILKILDHDIQAINKLARSWDKDSWKQFGDLLHNVPNILDPLTGKGNYLFRTSNELDTYYLQNFGRMPPKGTQEAFDAYKKTVKMDKALRMIHQYTVESRLGAEEHRIVTTDTKTGQPVYSDWFVGSRENKLPNTTGSILIPGKESGAEIAKSLEFHTKRENKALLKGAMEGKTQVIKLTHPEQFPLENFGKTGKSMVEYVAHNRIESRPLRFRDVPAITSEHEYPLSIKQPDIRFDPGTGRNIYLRDKVLGHLTTRKGADQLIETLNNVREAYKAGDIDAARLYGAKLPMGLKDYLNEFNSGRLDPDHPFTIVPRNAKIINMDRTLEKRFPKLDDRSLNAQLPPDPHQVFEFRNTGTRYNPIWDNQPAKAISPLTNINRGIDRGIRSLYWDDFRTHAIEHWVQEAKDHLVLAKGQENRLAQSPMAFFYHGELKSDAPIEVRARLEANRYKIRQLISTPSQAEAELHALSQRLVDSVYDKTGVNIEPKWTLPLINDWSKAAQSIAHYAFLGVWNPQQFVVNNMNYATIIGSSKFARSPIGGVLGGFLHQFSRMNENWVPGMDKMLSNMRLFKPDEFQELWKLGHDMGAFDLPRTHDWTPENLGTYVKGGVQQMADKSLFLWKAAEKNQKIAAWYTAGKDYRLEHPTGPITNQAANEILKEADRMAGDMTVAAKTMLQKGWAAMPMQFAGYGMRLAEMMTGNRLSGMQKLRLFGTYAMLFGLGGSFNIGLPLGDLFVRQQAKSPSESPMGTNYVPGENTLQTFMNEGILATGHYLLTGKVYNYRQRFSAVYVDAIKEIFSGAPTFKMYGGASLSVWAKAWENSDSLRTVMGNMNNPQQSPLKASDFADVLSGIKSIHTWRQAQEAINTANHLNDRGLLLERDITPKEAVMMALTGLQRQSTATNMDTRTLIRDREDHWKEVDAEVMKNFNRYYLAIDAKDQPQADDYYKKAMVALVRADYPEERLPILMHKISKAYGQTMHERGEEQYRLHNVPASQRQEQLEMYMRGLKR